MIGYAHLPWLQQQVSPADQALHEEGILWVALSVVAKQAAHVMTGAHLP